MTRRRVGLIVNPIAGMGGTVGLKGTDDDRARHARELGAEPIAAARAVVALGSLAACRDSIELLTCAGSMGADAAAAAGFASREIYRAPAEATSAADTREAASILLREGVDLILFAGGDGTARDMLAAVNGRVPVLGIPAGVKMHSAVFGVTPRAAGDAARVFLAADDGAALLDEAEVMDRPPGDRDAASPELCGYLRTPSLPRLVSHAKAAGAAGSVEGACRHAVERIRDSALALIGPGTTMRRVKQAFGFDGTLLGIDAVEDGRPAGLDLNEAGILELLGDRRALVVVSIVGGQGFLFGRGNQPLSPRVLRRAGLDNILVVASMEKVIALPGRRLLVDTGDDELDAMLCGYRPVIVGYRRSVQVPVGPPPHGAADLTTSGPGVAAVPDG